jgi:hypothetical protein
VKGLLMLTAFLTSAFLLPGCGPVGPSENKRDVFEGTLRVGSSAAKNFTASCSGCEYGITLSSFTPGELPVELALTYYAEGQCQQIVNYYYVYRLPETLPGLFERKGEYCAVISDVGFLTQDHNFRIIISYR